VGYTTSELDDDSNEGITITEPSGQVVSGATATVSFPRSHVDNFSVEQIKSSAVLVATESHPQTGERITHILHPEDSPTSSNAMPSNPDQTEPSPVSHQRTIRFRSRVRITSGVGKKHARPARRSSSDAGSGSDVPSRAHLRALASLSADWGGARSGGDSPRDSSVSVATSRSSSISSSISAPIRFREDEPPSSGRPSKWGPLGKRVQLFVGQQRAAKQQKLQAANGHINGGNGKRVVLVYDPGSRSYVPSTQSSSGEPPMAYSEESPLLGPGRGNRSYRGRRFSNSSSNSSTRGSYDSYDGRYDSETGWGPDGYEVRLNQEIERVFGPWPGRLLNRHVRLVSFIVY